MMWILAKNAYKKNSFILEAISCVQNLLHCLFMGLEYVRGCDRDNFKYENMYNLCIMYNLFILV